MFLTTISSFIAEDIKSSTIFRLLVRKKRFINFYQSHTDFESIDNKTLFYYYQLSTIFRLSAEKEKLVNFYQPYTDFESIDNKTLLYYYQSSTIFRLSAEKERLVNFYQLYTDFEPIDNKTLFYYYQLSTIFRLSVNNKKQINYYRPSAISYYDFPRKKTNDRKTTYFSIKTEKSRSAILIVKYIEHSNFI